MKTENQEETQELFSQDQIQTPLLTPAHDDTANVESGSSTSLEMDYEDDPDIPEGVISQSQPWYRRGIHYTPLGLRRVYRKKGNLQMAMVLQQLQPVKSIVTNPMRSNCRYIYVRICIA